MCLVGKKDGTGSMVEEGAGRARTQIPATMGEMRRYVSEVGRRIIRPSADADAPVNSVRDYSGRSGSISPVSIDFGPRETDVIPYVTATRSQEGPILEYIPRQSSVLHSARSTASVAAATLDTQLRSTVLRDASRLGASNQYTRTDPMEVPLIPLGARFRRTDSFESQSSESPRSISYE